MLKELFIKIGLSGAKDAVKDLGWVNGKLQETAKKAEKTTDKVNDLSKSVSSFTKVVNALTKALKGLAWSGIKNIGKGLLWLVKSPFKLAISAAKSFAGSLKRILEISLGFQLSNMFDRLATGARGFLTGSFDLAVQEQDTRQRLRETFKGDESGINSFLKGIQAIGEKFGADTGALANALASTSVDTKKLLRIATVIAKIQIKRPEVNAQILAGQIQNLLFSGDVDETLKSVAPQLLQMSRGQDSQWSYEAGEPYQRNWTSKQ